jgi:hypothetical protein
MTSEVYEIMLNTCGLKNDEEVLPGTAAGRRYDSF